MALLDVVADFVGSYRDGKPLPADVLEHAHKAFANWLIVATHAAASEEGQLYVRAIGGACSGTSPIVGTGVSTGAATAGLVNGALAHLDDFDDTHLETVTHPSTPVIAAVSAVLDESVSWERFLGAIAIGTEVVIRVAGLLAPSHYDRGWHVTASVGGIGAAAAVCTLWGLDSERTARAMALAALQPVGLRAAFGTSGKAFQVGRAAETGVLSGLLAREGGSAPADALEHPRGLRITSEDFRTEWLDGLGTRWEFLRDTFKPYPCGIVTHPVIDAGRALHAQVAERHDDIGAIRALVHPLVPELTGQRSPQNGLGTKFSASTLLAIALCKGSVTLDHFTRPVSRPVAEIAEKVQLVEDPEISRDSADVTVTFTDGFAAHVHVEHARGSAANPLTWTDLEEKCEACVGGVRPDWQAWWKRLRERQGVPLSLLSL